MEYKIIPIEESHIDGFWAAVDSVSRERKYLAFLEGPPIETTRDFVKENIREGWPQFVAICEGKVVGWCDITSLHRPIYAHSGELGIGVIAQYRGNGIGEALMRTTLNKAKSNRLTRVELTVREHNKSAKALYDKLGFVVEGVKRNGVRVDGYYEDMICMALLFE